MLQLPTTIDRTATALLRYFTAPIQDEAPVPLRASALPSGIYFPGYQLVVLAASAPVTLAEAAMTDIAMRYESNVMFVRLREDGIATVDLAMRHLAGIEVLRAMRAGRLGARLYFASPDRRMWALLGEVGLQLSTEPLWTRVQDEPVRSTVTVDLAALLSELEGR